MALTTAAIAAGVSAVSSLAGTGMSFAQAGKANAKAAEASLAAENALNEAKKGLDINFYDALSIKKEPYELQREKLLSQGAESIQAAREGDQRGVGTVAGRVQLAQNEAQQGITTQMNQDLMNLEKLSAAEDSRLRDVAAQINLAEAEGAQSAVANYSNLAGRAETQAMEGIVNTGKAVATMLPLYAKQNFNFGTKKANPASSNQGFFSDTGMGQPTTLGTPSVNQGFFNNTMAPQQFNYADPFGVYANQQNQLVVG